MKEMFALPVVLLGVTEPDNTYAIVVSEFSTAMDCALEVTETMPALKEAWPEGIFWCSAPLQGFVYVMERPGAWEGVELSELAPRASIRPQPRPENLDAE